MNWSAQLPLFFLGVGFTGTCRILGWPTRDRLLTMGFEGRSVGALGGWSAFLATWEATADDNPRGKSTPSFSLPAPPFWPCIPKLQPRWARGGQPGGSEYWMSSTCVPARRWKQLGWKKEKVCDLLSIVSMALISHKILWIYLPLTIICQ